LFKLLFIDNSIRIEINAAQPGSQTAFILLSVTVILSPESLHYRQILQ